MTTITKVKLKKSNDQTNIDTYRVATNITKYQIISKFFFLSIVIPKLIEIWQLFYAKMYVIMSKINIIK